MSKFIERVLEHDPALRQVPNPYTLTQTSEVFNRVITGKEILERVTAYLIRKGLYESREQSEYNKSTLGNVQFWIKNTRRADKTVVKSELAFGSTIDTWSFEAILQSVEEAERTLLIQQGVSIDANYKPV